MPQTKTNRNALTGAAGVFYVASELSYRGLICLPTIRNTPGADIMVTDQAGTLLAHLQVKTAYGKANHWPLGARVASWTAKNCYYVFVRRSGGRFEAFLEKAAVVAREAAKVTEMGLSRGYKKWADCWFVSGKWTVDDPGREERTRRQWEAFPG